MQPARFRQADFSLVKINNAKSMFGGGAQGPVSDIFCRLQTADSVQTTDYRLQQGNSDRGLY